MKLLIPLTASYLLVNGQIDCNTKGLKPNFTITNGEWKCNKKNICSVICNNPQSGKVKKLKKMVKCDKDAGAWIKASPKRPEIGDISCEFAENNDNNQSQNNENQCQEQELHDISWTHGSWACVNKKGNQICSAKCDETGEILYKKIASCQDGAWTLAEGKKNPKSWTDLATNIATQCRTCSENDEMWQNPSKGGKWVKESDDPIKYVLQCDEGYTHMKYSSAHGQVDQTTMTCVSWSWPAGWKTRWRVYGSNKCRKNFVYCDDDLAVPNPEDYAPGKFTCGKSEWSQSCYFKCGNNWTPYNDKVRQCKDGEWVDVTPGKEYYNPDSTSSSYGGKDDHNWTGDVACCLGVDKPTPPENGSFEGTCIDDRVGSTKCWLNCNNVDMVSAYGHNKYYKSRIRGQITCVGNKWVETGLISCDLQEIKDHLVENGDPNGGREETGVSYVESLINEQ